MNLEDAHGGRRGDVRRLSPSSPAEKDPHAVSSSISRIRWSRRQDHHAHYTTLIRLELEDELVAVEERLRAWSDRRLKDAGIALFRLRSTSPLSAIAQAMYAVVRSFAPRKALMAPSAMPPWSGVHEPSLFCLR